MSKCKWREKPGGDETCGLLADAGSEFCPRHIFLDGVRKQKQIEKERKAVIDRKVVTPMPKTRRQLMEYGYQFRGNGTCRSCDLPIEWWLTPNAKNAPYDPMPELDSPARSHFATCTRNAEFRRAS